MGIMGHDKKSNLDVIVVPKGEDRGKKSPEANLNKNGLKFPKSGERQQNPGTEKLQISSHPKGVHQDISQSNYQESKQKDSESSKT